MVDCDFGCRCDRHVGGTSFADSVSGWTPIAFSFSDQFFGIKSMQDAKRTRCKYHSDLLGWDVWVSTEWNREDEGLGSERYEVRATATAHECQADHGGATDDRTITKAQWENAAPNVNWDFFPTL